VRQQMQSAVPITVLDGFQLIRLLLYVSLYTVSALIALLRPTTGIGLPQGLNRLPCTDNPRRQSECLLQ
jgi:hypothetical protein